MLPTPPGLALKIRPNSAFWSPELSQFILLYEDVQQAAAQTMCCWNFQSTYEAGAKLAAQDRTALERGT